VTLSELVSEIVDLQIALFDIFHYKLYFPHRYSKKRIMNNPGLIKPASRKDRPTESCPVHGGIGSVAA